jgi:phospholipase A1
MLSISFNHGFNGRETPLSRGWNGRETPLSRGWNGRWQVYVRPWLRLDDNPDIVEYISKGDAVVNYAYKKNLFTFTGSHNLSFNGYSKEYAEFASSYQIQST